MTGQDAEIAADIDEDGADRPGADLGGDLLRRGQAGEAGGGRLGGAGGGLGSARPGLRPRGGESGWFQVGGTLDEPRLKRVGEEQAMGDAREDHCNVAGAEGARAIAARSIVVLRSRSVVTSSLP